MKICVHLLRWIIAAVIVCLLFLGIERIVGIELVHEICEYLAIYYVVSSTVKSIEKER